jgi:hypothetical protein
VQLNQCYSLITCLFFYCSLKLLILSWFCLLSSSVCRIPCRIFCSGGLVVIYCFSFYLSWKTFIPPSILDDNFAGQGILGLKLFSFSAWYTSLHALFVLKFLLRNLLLFWWVYPYTLFVFSLTAFNSLSLFSVLVVLMIICCGEALFWLSLFGVLEASCTWMGKTFSRFRKFSVIILLNILCVPFACAPSHSSMPIILRFGLLIETLSSWIFLS